ncbi:MAG: hypothetical protein M0Z99_23270 [Betaproteobacteria bacterium]|nr:hypothetical protein [Betaproteobacteria bacterium]
MKYRIYRQHTHAGVTYPAFSVVELPEEDAQWLMQAEGAVRAQNVQEAAQAMEDHGLEPIVAPEPEQEPENEDDE